MVPRRLRGGWLVAALGVAVAAIAVGLGVETGLMDRLLGRPVYGPRADFGPRDTLSALHAAAQARSYERIAALTLPERAAGLVETLRAVHAFVDEERRFRAVITEHFGRHFGQALALAHFADNLGALSAEARLLDEVIDGERARVTFIVAETPPAQSAALRRRDGVWLYDPGPGFDPAWPRTFAAMARVLRDMRGELASGRRSSQAVRADPQTFLQELGDRLSAAAGGLPTSRPTGGPG